MHLAQVNIAVAREPLDSPLLAEFMAALEPVNARAELAPGFVWRLQDEAGDATGIRGFGGDEQLAINLTVWTDLETMREWVYRDPAHVALMRRRREWFVRLELHTVLWWVRDGHRPSVPEAERRLEHLGAHGPTAHAFSFALPFGPDASTAPVADPDAWRCPA